MAMMTQKDLNSELQNQIIISQPKSLYHDYYGPRILPYQGTIKLIESSKEPEIESNQNHVLSSFKEPVQTNMNSLKESQMIEEHVQKKKQQFQQSDQDTLDYDQLEKQGQIFNNKIWNTPVKNQPIDQIVKFSDQLRLQNTKKNGQIFKLIKMKETIEHRQQRQYIRKNQNIKTSSSQKLGQLESIDSELSGEEEYDQPQQHATDYKIRGKQKNAPLIPPVVAEQKIFLTISKPEFQSYQEDSKIIIEIQDDINISKSHEVSQSKQEDNKSQPQLLEKPGDCIQENENQNAQQVSPIQQDPIENSHIQSQLDQLILQLKLNETDISFEQMRENIEYPMETGQQEEFCQNETNVRQIQFIDQVQYYKEEEDKRDFELLGRDLEGSEQDNSNNSQFRQASSQESQGDDDTDRQVSMDNLDLDNQEEMDAGNFLYLLPISVTTVGEGRQAIIPPLGMFGSSVKSNDQYNQILNLKVWDSEQIMMDIFDDCMDKFRQTYGQERNDEELAAILQLCDNNENQFNYFIEEHKDQINYWLQNQEFKQKQKQCQKLKRGRKKQINPIFPEQIQPPSKLRKESEFKSYSEQLPELQELNTQLEPQPDFRILI